MYAINQTLVFIGQLLGKLAHYDETANQHAEVENLVAVAERQITREKSICPIAKDLYLNVGSNRPEMVDTNVFEQLKFQLAMGEMMGMIEVLVRSGQVGVQIIELYRGKE